MSTLSHRDVVFFASTRRAIGEAGLDGLVALGHRLRSDATVKNQRGLDAQDLLDTVLIPRYRALRREERLLEAAAAPTPVSSRPRDSRGRFISVAPIEDVVQVAFDTDPDGINPATGCHFYGSKLWNAEDNYAMMDDEEREHFMR